MTASPDILVIGGGPAGAACAIWAGRLGLRVVLLERTAFPRHRPGETLHPGVESILDQLGVGDKVAAGTEIRHAGHAVTWAGKTTVRAFGRDAGGPWLGYQIARERLDAILLGRARDLGVEVLQPQAATGRPIVFDGRVAGLLATEPHRARFVVDASGARGTLRRALGLSRVAVSPPLRACYGYGVSHEDVELLPSLVGHEGGWTWIAQIGRRRFAWTMVGFEAETRQAAPPCVTGIEWLKPIRGADVTWRLVPDCAGPGYFLAGDAAAVVDPASSHGVLRALMSGIMAAHVASNVIAGSASETDGVEHYRTWMRSWFEHDARTMRELYAALGVHPAWAKAGSAPRGPGSSEALRPGLQRL